MPATPRDPRLPQVSRRGLVVAGTAVLLGGALVGCSAADDSARAAEPEGSPSLSPDVALATLALAELRAAGKAVRATARRFPAVDADLAPVAAMHAAHESALVDAVPEGAEPATRPAAYDVPARRAAALTRLRQRESELQARLADLAVDARSGAFAELLASMSAGVAQRVARWPA